MRRFLSLFACLLAVGGSVVAGSSARADVSDADAAYCPYGSVNGSGTWTPPESTTLSPHTFAWTTTASCTSDGDEGGSYAISFAGAANDSCVAGSGSGTMSGVGPEGSITGPFNFYRIGIHLYI